MYLKFLSTIAGTLKCYLDELNEVGGCKPCNRVTASQLEAFGKHVQSSNSSVSNLKSAEHWFSCNNDYGPRGCTYIDGYGYRIGLLYLERFGNQTVSPTNGSAAWAPSLGRDVDLI